MSTVAAGHGSKTGKVKITREDLLGTERRWRRFGEPTAAGESLNEDGTPDYGIFGPGSVAWEVLLHPATVVFLNAAQGAVQTKGYNPINAGLRDRDPVTRKAREGTLNMLDVFDRLSRNSGMHAPMWLGDSKTAKLMAKHLHNIHKKVAGDVIDTVRPELGGYAASEPRDAMWAALTEMHPMLRVYEAFAFRDGKFPHRLSPEQRDQFVAETGAYLRLVGAPEEDIPTNMAELGALYEKYADLFEPSTTVNKMPDTGEDWVKLSMETVTKNFHISHLRALVPYLLQTTLVELPVMGALPARMRRSMGLSPRKDKVAARAAKLFLPIAWLMQQGPYERYVLRRMWGPDSIRLLESARRLHEETLARRAMDQLVAGANSAGAPAA
ncbi:oxygenase MpaB family protein [Streptomyces soliscabiei]|uniref:oxygenase MpaB family protein n=1 Tax=Streptomyces soliscabiei TaxID=588897 RepID=UPI00299FDEF1|nr:oxygenase MpaB family protein [Streptomyces sp. NY05-11A]MDX2683744.1 oxygenase MpaB family protein [Streptomyces sp. NY05-11A]